MLENAGSSFARILLPIGPRRQGVTVAVDRCTHKAYHFGVCSSGDRSGRGIDLMTLGPRSLCMSGSS